MTVLGLSAYDSRPKSRQHVKAKMPISNIFTFSLPNTTVRPFTNQLLSELRSTAAFYPLAFCWAVRRKALFSNFIYVPTSYSVLETPLAAKVTVVRQSVN